MDLKKIPQFFARDEEDVRIRKEARLLQIQKMGQDSIDAEELQQLWVILEKFSSDLQSDQPQTIDYIAFKQIASLLGVNSKAKQYFTATVFAKLRDDNGKILISDLFNYITRKVWLRQTRINLSVYDQAVDGYLRDTDLESYIQDQIPTLTQLDQMDSNYYPFYVCVAVRKFLFFLDPFKHGKVRIVDILISGFLDDLLELRFEDLLKNRESSNWFWPSNTQRLYDAYMRLDEDQNGMLNRKELAMYNGSSLTTEFIDRIFNTCITYSGEIDFKVFIDFVLAMENKKEPQSIYFFFNLLDINEQKYLDAYTIHYFLKAIQEKLKGQMKDVQEVFKIQDVCNEIFDMVKPEVPGKITFIDLVSCGQAKVVIDILTDISGFLAYENREIQLTQGEEEATI